MNQVNAFNQPALPANIAALLGLKPAGQDNTEQLKKDLRMEDATIIVRAKKILNTITKENIGFLSLIEGIPMMVTAGGPGKGQGFSLNKNEQNTFRIMVGSWMAAKWAEQNPKRTFSYNSEGFTLTNENGFYYRGKTAFEAIENWFKENATVDQAKQLVDQVKSKANKTTTLEEVVKKSVELITAKNLEFSAWEVTQSIRLVFGGPKAPAIITDCVTDDGECFVPHKKVREQIHAMFEAGEIPGYDRENNGEYWEYFPKEEEEETEVEPNTEPEVVTAL